MAGKRIPYTRIGKEGISCPWCDSKSIPVPTDLSRAIAVHGNPLDPKWQALNPAMCPDCLRCGGWEDFGVSNVRFIS